MEILTVTSSVLQCVRDQIITGELKPGQKLNESSLSESIGISRQPLREAFRLLVKDRLVVNIPRKGTYVAELSMEDLEEVYQIREMIECYAIDLLKASNIRDLPNVITALNRASAVQFNSSDPEELLNHIKIIAGFHICLVESAGNSLLTDLYHSISANLSRYQFIYFSIAGSGRHSSDDHKRVLELITNGNYDQAKKELEKHIRYTMDLVKSKVLLPSISSAVPLDYTKNSAGE